MTSGIADSGMLAALHALAALGSQAEPLSRLLAQYSRYSASGEINTEVTDQAAVTARVRGMSSPAAPGSASTSWTG